MVAWPLSWGESPASATVSNTDPLNAEEIYGKYPFNNQHDYA
jgi:hypothetical protein